MALPSKQSLKQQHGIFGDELGAPPCGRTGVLQSQTALAGLRNLLAPFATLQSVHLISFGSETF